MFERLNLRLRVLLFFVAIAAGCLLAVGTGLWLAGRRMGVDVDVSALVFGGTVAGFSILGLVTWIWYLFDENVARAIQALSGAMRARTYADLADPLDAAPARYLGDLAPAAAAVTETLAETRNALAEAIQRETVRLAGEKDRLAALLADVPVGVLSCTGDHQMVFYNAHAAELLEAVAGLDRSVFDYLRPEPLRHAHQRLIDTEDPDAASDLLCTTKGAAHTLAGRMRLTAPQPGNGGGRPGYVLTLRDVTADMAAHAGRAALLDEVLDRVRRPAANLQTIIAARAEAGNGGAALDVAMTEEAARLAQAVTDVARRHDESRAAWSPLSPVRATDLGDAIRARIEAAGLVATVEAQPLLIRCDGFGLVALMGELAERVAETGLSRQFAVRLAEDGAGAVLDLGWRGGPLAVGQLERWIAAPVEIGMADATGRTILDIHGTECWPEQAGADGGRIRLPLREVRRAGPRPPPIARAVAYDFDLMSKAAGGELADTPLAGLTCVVFDTETTGLMPSGGDEIVQIAAVRIVNGRRVAGEIFDTLVNPGRKIPPRSTEVHGITDAMVAAAPGIGEVGRQFHGFAAGAVLVAHNAPFDMEFLRRHESTIGARFDNPILDTVLLSAVVFGQDEVHSLDALSHRLGITIPEEARHTALGDTVATADAYLKLVPMLRAKGLDTFGQVLAQVRRHGRLLKDLNG
jgi:DNA polymerase-3 subunit epsilon